MKNTGKGKAAKATRGKAAKGERETFGMNAMAEAARKAAENGNNPDLVSIPAMRTQEEIQRAHDLLVGFILADEDGPTAPVPDLILRTTASVLCWTLHHDHNEAFASLLHNLEAVLGAAGIALTRAEQPFKGQHPKEWRGGRG